jgi:suppressor for copper-sensitivity B
VAVLHRHCPCGGHTLAGFPPKRSRPHPLSGGEEQTHVKGLLTVELKPGWKTYWRSPGEGGVAPKISWPEGVTDSWSWPVPSRFDISGMTTQGYHDKVTIPIRSTE